MLMLLELGLLTRYDIQAPKNAEKKVHEALTVLVNKLHEYPSLPVIIIVFDN